MRRRPGSRPPPQRASRRFDEERFEAEKRASVGQLLFRCARLFNEEAIRRVRRRFGVENLRTAHTALFPHLELDGIRLTELSRRLGVSKQAVSEWVDELEAMGMLAKVPDPDDRRAKRIVFTPKGKRGLFGGLAVLAELEAELAKTVGARQMAQLHEALLVLLPALEALDD